ncbi:MAG: hypothetical protein NTV34_10160 [Proteobacteria bacterium]|nr:hypothetical protein [Pseudomonadota bacterium]
MRFHFTFAFMTLVASQSVFADAVAYPYNCDPAAGDGRGWTLVYPYHTSCNLRQPADQLDDCKRNVEERERTFYAKIEASLQKRCHNENGSISSSWCLVNNTWEQSNSHWHFQSAKQYRCVYN